MKNILKKNESKKEKYKKIWSLLRVSLLSSSSYNITTISNALLYIYIYIYNKAFDIIHLNFEKIKKKNLKS
jgi:hypothetical protein